jgi:hypothetical protein
MLRLQQARSWGRHIELPVDVACSIDTIRKSLETLDSLIAPGRLKRLLDVLERLARLEEEVKQAAADGIFEGDAFGTGPAPGRRAWTALCEKSDSAIPYGHMCRDWYDLGSSMGQDVLCFTKLTNDADPAQLRLMLPLLDQLSKEDITAFPTLQAAAELRT